MKILTAAEAIFGGIKVDNWRLATKDIFGLMLFYGLKWEQQNFNQSIYLLINRYIL